MAPPVCGFCTNSTPGGSDLLCETPKWPLIRITGTAGRRARAAVASPSPSMLPGMVRSVRTAATLVPLSSMASAASASAASTTR